MPIHLAFLSLFVFVLVCIACGNPGGNRKTNEPPDDFIDHTERYKGRELTLRLTLENYYRVEANGVDDSLRGRTQPEVEFYDFVGSSRARLDLTINVPLSLTVPAAKYGDTLLVTFVCKDGKLTSGNEAKKVERTP